MRGKARYIFEFKFELKCACTVLVYATIKFPEVSSDEDLVSRRHRMLFGLSPSMLS